MYWFNIPEKLVNKVKNIDLFDVKLHRLTKAANIVYEVKYIMEKRNDPYKINNNKYAMFVRWREGDNFLIIVGQNPAVCKTINNQRYHIDETNWNIIKFLRNKYDGYIMVNTFSEIDPNGKNINHINCQCKNISILNNILKYLQTKKYV